VLIYCGKLPYVPKIGNRLNVTFSCIPIINRTAVTLELTIIDFYSYMMQ